MIQIQVTYVKYRSSHQKIMQKIVKTMLFGQNDKMLHIRTKIEARTNILSTMYFKFKAESFHIKFLCPRLTKTRKKRRNRN